MTRHAKRSKLDHSAKVENEQGLASDVLDSTLANKEEQNNTTGLGSLPHELLHEILSYFPPIAPPIAADNTELVEENLRRREIYFALSQTCSNLRRFFRSYAWERIEVVHGVPIPGDKKLSRGGGKAAEKEFAVELIRQLEIVSIRDPSLAEHVKILNVEIPGFSLRPVMEELGRCFSLFSRLHTVKIRMLESKTADTAARFAFNDYVYPSVKTAILSRASFPLLASCPHIDSLHLYDDHSTEDVVKYLQSPEDIKTLRCVLKPRVFGDLLKYLPDVQHISILIKNMHERIEDYPNLAHITNQLRAVASLQGLETIWCDFEASSWGYYGHFGTTALLLYLKQMLVAIQSRDKLEKRLVFRIHVNLSESSLPMSPVNESTVVLPALPISSIHEPAF